MASLAAVISTFVNLSFCCFLVCKYIGNMLFILPMTKPFRNCSLVWKSVYCLICLRLCILLCSLEVNCPISLSSLKSCLMYVPSSFIVVLLCIVYCLAVKVKFLNIVFSFGLLFMKGYRVMKI